jgi:hypothetical protein
MFGQGFTCPALLEDPAAPFAYGAVTRSGRPFQTVRLGTGKATGLLRFRSPLLAESHLMSVPPGTEMFQFPGFASGPYGFGTGYPRKGGFPHSDIRGSTIARISPRLFAACHVLRRLLAPRHPPIALVTLRIATTTAPACRTEPRPPRHASCCMREPVEAAAPIARALLTHTRTLETTQPIPDSLAKEQ